MNLRRESSFLFFSIYCFCLKPSIPTGRIPSHEQVPCHYLDRLSITKYDVIMSRELQTSEELFCRHHRARRRKSPRHQLPEHIAMVDDGGNLSGHVRMDRPGIGTTDPGLDANQFLID